MSFALQLKRGQMAESAITQWLRYRGWFVLPVYEVATGNYKGPRLYTPQDALTATDMFVFKGSDARWVEAKNKAAFTWHRQTGRWTTGIDLPLYEHYLRIETETPWPVVLLFLHEGGQAKDSPPDSPAGLFYHYLKYLKGHINHTHENGGRHGMVYWAIETLELATTLEELRAIGAL